MNIRRVVQFCARKEGNSFLDRVKTDGCPDTREGFDTTEYITLQHSICNMLSINILSGNKRIE